MATKKKKSTANKVEPQFLVIDHIEGDSSLLRGMNAVKTHIAGIFEESSTERRNDEFEVYEVKPCYVSAEKEVSYDVSIHYHED
jgi:hypothetical protein